MILLGGYVCHQEQKEYLYLLSIQNLLSVCTVQFEMMDEFFKENGSRRLIFFYQDMKVCVFNYNALAINMLILILRTYIRNMYEYCIVIVRVLYTSIRNFIIYSIYSFLLNLSIISCAETGAHSGPRRRRSDGEAPLPDGWRD